MTEDRSPIVYGWDWTATTHEGRTGIVDDLLGAMGAAVTIEGKGLHGWAQSLQAYDAEGYSIGGVYFSGGRDDVHVLATSAAADPVRHALRENFPGKTARVDTRVDTLTPWADLAAVAESAAAIYGSELVDYRRRKNGEECGRTIYLGAPSSAVRVRMYEKWLESPGEYPEGTNRVEVQLRPASNVKAKVSAWDPADTFCASKVTRHLAELLGDDAAPKNSLHVKRGTPDLERAVRAAAAQYGPTLHRYLTISGGDQGALLERLLGTDAECQD